MTAKEKARELVDTYRIMLMNTDTDCGEEILCTITAKYAALIAVDEILKTHKKISVSHQIFAYRTAKYFMQSVKNIQDQIDNHVLNNFGYWAEVKQQIELL